MAKIKFSPEYRRPATMDAIAVMVFIPRKILNEIGYVPRQSIPTETMIKILENSEYEILEEEVW